MNKEIKLPSGASLKITLSPFMTSKALYQAFLGEMKNIKFSMSQEVENVMKDIICHSLASKEFEACLWECMKKATYNDIKITEDTFEPEDARQDYFEVMFEVAKANITPFTKGLYAQYAPLFELLKQKLQA